MRNILIEKSKEFGGLLLVSALRTSAKTSVLESARSSEKGNCLSAADCIYKGQSEVFLYP